MRPVGASRLRPPKADDSDSDGEAEPGREGKHVKADALKVRLGIWRDMYDHRELRSEERGVSGAYVDPNASAEGKGAAQPVPRPAGSSAAAGAAPKRFKRPPPPSRDRKSFFGEDHMHG